MKIAFFGVLLCIILLATTNVFSQYITLQGYVQDALTREPIAYASVSIENGNIGTPTNEDGLFILKIPSTLQDANLIVSFVGYEISRLKISAIQDKSSIRILLKESSHLLQEITVSPESPAQIVARAYRNISLNYPLSNTLYTGFYRESNLQRPADSAQRHYYVIEAITKINKPSYQRRYPEGNIKLIQVRKNQFVPESQKFARWTAGAFTPMRFDVVKKRFDFIDPDHQDRYTYSIEDYTTYYDKDVFKISFKPAKNSADYEGVLYIDRDNYAIVKVDYQFSQKGLQRENSDRSDHTLLDRRQFKINYQPIEDKWYIQSVWQQATGQDKISGKYFRYMTEYATTRIDTNSYEDFEYGDKIQWGEVFLTKANPYNENFWKEYNIVAETQTLKNLLIDTTYQLRVREASALKPTDSSSQKDFSFKRKKRRFRNSYSLVRPYLVHFSAKQMTIQYTNEENSFSINETLNFKNTQLAWSNGLGLEYDVYKSIYISVQTYLGFSKFKYNSIDLGAGYRFLVSK